MDSAIMAIQHGTTNRGTDSAYEAIGMMQRYYQQECQSLAPEDDALPE
jgi:hypothetical protein